MRGTGTTGSNNTQPDGTQPDNVHTVHTNVIDALFSRARGRDGASWLSRIMRSKREGRTRGPSVPRQWPPKHQKNKCSTYLGTINYSTYRVYKFDE